jgi:hypothetical protein
MPDGTQYWGGGPDRVYFEDPDARPTETVHAHFKGSFVRDLAVMRITSIATQLSDRDHGYEATDAMEDLLTEAAKLAAFAALRTPYGTAPEAEMAVLSETISRRIGEMIYRAIKRDGGGEVWPRRSDEPRDE